MADRRSERAEPMNSSAFAIKLTMLYWSTNCIQYTLNRCNTSDNLQKSMHYRNVMKFT